VLALERIRNLVEPSDRVAAHVPPLDPGGEPNRFRSSAGTIEPMSYTSTDARQQILDELARSIGHIGGALEALGEAYERMDEHTGDRLEEELFRPVQAAYGRAQRAHMGFADRV